MLERVIAYIERHGLLPEQGGIVVAVSGGADSLCLLHLLLQICGTSKRYPHVSLQAVHLNHMLRGEASVRDARMVARIMQVWEVPFILGEVDVIALAKAEKRSLEEAARLARYRFLREVAQGRRIAVAHHADDQVETLLLHWLRGSGLTGMVGMLPHQQDIIRPLLDVTHSETLAYCQEQSIVPLEDLSNSDPHFLRNRIRHELVPLLQALNPGIQRTLLRNAEIVRVDLAWLETQVEQSWPNVVVSESSQTIQLNVHALLALPLSLQRHLLRRVTAHLCEGQSPLEPRHFLLIEDLLNEPASSHERELHLPQRLRLSYQLDNLFFERVSHPLKEIAEPTNEKANDHETILPLPGQVLVPGTAWLARAELLAEELAIKVRAALSQENWPEVWRLLDPVTPHTIYIDGETLGTSLLVRTRRSGDRIQPLGMSQEKRVQDIFIDNHVPRANRATMPLFFSNAHCLWVAGSCLDQRIRLTKHSQRVVRLSIEYTGDLTYAPGY
jgi:tRNA(Ile)-lysidine synthase